MFGVKRVITFNRGFSLAKNKYYVIFRGRNPGIYTEWYGKNGAEEQITGFPNARYQGFLSKEEAEKAYQEWVIKNPLPAPGQLDFTSEISGKSVLHSAPTDSVPLKAVTIYTDGGCSYNPGPGGYGAVIITRNQLKELSAGYRMTTNNRMEIMACIVALDDLKERSEVTLYSDSQYVVNAITKGWAKRWQRHNWKRNSEEDAENPDLWERMLSLCEKHQVNFVWIKGHAGRAENERCDQLAVQAARGTDLQVDEFYEQKKVSNRNHKSDRVI